MCYRGSVIGGFFFLELGIESLEINIKKEG